MRVLQNLLAEGVQIRDIRTIAETLVEHAGRSQDPVALTAAVRVSLSRMIVQNINGLENELDVMTLNPDLERILQESLQGGEGGLGLEPGLAQRLLQSLEETVKRQEMAGKPAVLVVSPQIRYWLAQWLRPAIPSLHVLAFNEIPDNRQVRVVATVGG